MCTRYRLRQEMFDQNVSYIEMSPELSEIAANINQLKQEAESNARLAKENEQRKNDLIMYLAHDLKTPLSSVIGYLTLLRDESQILILSILVDTFISKISLPMQPVPEIGSISVA